MLSSWDESSTYSGLGSGIQTNDIEAAAVKELTIDAGDLGWISLSGLEATVQAWSDGETNYGWAFISDDADSWVFASSEDANASLRPYLIIDYTPVNNAPAASANTVSTTEDNAYNFSAGDFTFSDTEGDSLVSATITNLSLAGGSLTHSGGTAVISGDTLTAA